MPSTLREKASIRGILDYLHWAATRMLALGAQAGPGREGWRERIWRAYSALFIPPVLGHGDPYPPDVPPAQTPGIWPDIPAAGITGMTVRHQLTVVAMLSESLRQARFSNLRTTEFAEWDRRLARAREAMEQGPENALPEEARTRPSKEAMDDMAARERAIVDDARRRKRQIQRLVKEPSAKGAKAKAARAPAKAAAPRAVKPKRPAPKKAAPAKKAKKK
jgi:hypothetical protein